VLSVRAGVLGVGRAEGWIPGGGSDRFKIDYSICTLSCNILTPVYDTFSSVAYSWVKQKFKIAIKYFLTTLIFFI
jgi:hypothetical protein